MVTFNNFITQTLTLTDTTLQQFVSQAFAHLQEYINTLLTPLMVVYILWVGYQALYASGGLTLGTLTQHAIRLIIIITLTTHSDYYTAFVYNIFAQEPAYISQAIAGDSNAAVSGLSLIWTQGSHIAAQWFDLRGMMSYIYGSVGYACTFGVCLYALGLLVVAKAAMAVLLAIGPLFILLMLFSSTRELTAGWLRGLINFALVPIVTTALLLLTNQLMKAGLPTTTDDADNFFVYVGFSVVSFILLRQVHSICALLSSSVALENIGHSAAQLYRQGKGAVGHAAGLAASSLKGAKQLAQSHLMKAAVNRLRPRSSPTTSTRKH